MKDRQPFLEDFFSRLRRRRWAKRLGRFAIWLAFFLLLLVIGLWLLLQNERFQNWALYKTSTYLSEQLNTTVSIDHFEFELFDKLVMDGIFVADQQGDTLLYSKSMRASMSINLLNLLQKNIDIDDLYIEDAQFHIKRDSGEISDNLQFIIDYLSSDEKKEANKSSKSQKSSLNPMFFDIDYIYLKNVEFIKDDVVKGKKLLVNLPSAMIEVEQINLQQMDIDLGLVNIVSPYVELNEQPARPLAPEQERKKESSNSLGGDMELSVRRLSLDDGGFRLANTRKAPVRMSPSDELDFKHLSVYDVSIIMDRLSWDAETLRAAIDKISLEEESGFEIKKLAARQAELSSKKLALYGLDLITPDSHVKDSVVMKFKDFKAFKNFEDEVTMDVVFNNSRVAVKDVIAFVPKLKNNAFFKKNLETVLDIDGRVKGKVNLLRGRDLRMQLGRGTFFKGDFNSRNLAVRQEESLNLKLERLQTDIHTLRLLLPNFNPPANFNKLGNIDFSGRFDGFFIDFVAFGELHTELGSARLDMRMDLRDGRDQAKYTGSLDLQNFDLRTWSDNDDLGIITVTSKVTEGQGLSLATVNTKLEANIETFSFRDYIYENVALNGELNRHLFDGRMKIDDENVRLDFNGSINFADSIPVINFVAKVAKVDLHAINLSKRKLEFAGQIEVGLRNIKLSEIQGKAQFANLRMVENGTEVYEIDKLSIVSRLTQGNRRIFQLNSEVVEAELEGRFDIQQIPKAFAGFLERNHAEFAERLNIKSKNGPLKPSDFNFFVKIKDSKNFLKLVHPKLDTVQRVVLEGYFNSLRDSLNFDLNVPRLSYDKAVFNDVTILLNGNERQMHLDLGVFKTLLNADQSFEPISLQGDIERDTFDFELNATNFSKLLDNLNLRGQFFLAGEHFQVRFLPSKFIIFNEPWSIDASNYVRFGKEFIETKNFELRRGNELIRLQSISDKGLNVSVEGFDLSLIDEFWSYKQLDFDGRFKVEADIQDVFKLKEVKLAVLADTFLVNGDDWGALRLDAHMADRQAPLTAYMSITKPSQQLTAEGYFVPPNAKRKKWMTHKYELTTNINNYPMYIAEYWIGNGVTNTQGNFDGQFKIYGESKPHIEGELNVRNLAITINYLQTRYFAESGTMKVNDQYFLDVSGNTITDRYGNEAYLQGGITHQYLKNLGLNATISSPYFLALDTEKEDNDLYYGHAFLSGEVRFSGSFQRTNISIDARSGVNSELFIPLTDERDASEVSFIRFIDKNAKKKEKAKSSGEELKGIALDMNLSVTKDGKISLIFDERAGDVIEGRGDGYIQMFITRSGEFTMYGNYAVEEGQYLFTWYNLVNKPFAVRQGGTINWTGDPYNAQIDLVAEYSGLSTSLYNFLIEYLNDDNLKAEARNSTNVDLTMLLTGPLQHPDIQFDIDFPNLTGEMKNYTESKMRIIRGDQNELNRQVFGLLVVGSFLPSSETALAGSEGLIGINTLSEMVSSQLSIYLTELLSEVFTDVGFISGVDFNINYNRYQADELNLEGDRVTGNQLELDFKYKFWDDRLALNLGGDIDWAGGQVASENGAFLAGEFVVEYALSKDRRFKVRFYQRTDESLATGRRNKTGLGLSFRREFESFSEFFKGMKKSAKKLTQ